MKAALWVDNQIALMHMKAAFFNSNLSLAFGAKHEFFIIVHMPRTLPIWPVNFLSDVADKSQYRKHAASFRFFAGNHIFRDRNKKDLLCIISYIYHT